MPRNFLRAQEHDRSRSLGWLATAWIEHFVRHGAHGLAGQEIQLTDEFCGLLVDIYAHDPEGERLYSHAFYSRPKGCYKSGFAAFMVLFDTLGPSRFDGFAEGGEVYEDPWGMGFTYEYQPGEPMGRHISQPSAMILATEESQTSNVYATIHWNLDKGPLSEIMPRGGAGLTRCLLPDGGQITPSTSGAASKDGRNPTIIVADEVHLYFTPELRNMFVTADGNLHKRSQDEPLFLITTTWFQAGQNSIAEDFFGEFNALTENQQLDAEDQNSLLHEGLLFDHRYGEIEPDDLQDRDLLEAALSEAYGDALEWNPLKKLVQKVYNPRTAVSWTYRYLLNAPSVLADQWLAPWEVNGAGVLHPADGLPEIEPIRPGDVIVMGFDGSEGRTDDRIADSTALVGCRVSDGALFVIGHWFQPPGLRVKGKGEKVWEPPRAEIEAAIASAFNTYNVVGFFGDPAGWTSEMAGWAAKYGKRLRVKAGQQSPIQWWMTGRSSTRTAMALTAFKEALLSGQARHFDEPALVEQLLSARMVGGRTGVQITKPDSPQMARKIDLAVAAVIAWQARLAALSAGATEPADKPKRRSYTFANMYAR